MVGGFNPAQIAQLRIIAPSGNEYTNCFEKSNHLNHQLLGNIQHSLASIVANAPWKADISDQLRKREDGTDGNTAQKAILHDLLGQN